VKIAIQDATGKTVRTLPGTKHVGINRIWWDLRYEPAKEIRLRTNPLYAPEVPFGPEGWRPAPGVSRLSLLAPPGTYTLKLMAGGQESTQKLAVLKDPHSGGTEADIEEQNKLFLEIQDEANALSESVNQLESIRAQLAGLVKELGTGDSSKPVRAAADELAKKLMDAEGQLIQLKATGRGQDDVRWSPLLLEKVVYLGGQVDGSDFAPTTQQVQVQALFKEQAAKVQAQIQQVLTKDVSGFNAMLREKNIPNLIVRAP
jgi:hypothetical protein